MRFMIWIYVKIATKIHTKIQIGLHSFVNYLTYLFGHEQPVTFVYSFEYFVFIYYCFRCVERVNKSPAKIFYSQSCRTIQTFAVLLFNERFISVISTSVLWMRRYLWYSFDFDFSSAFPLWSFQKKIWAFARPSLFVVLCIAHFSLGFSLWFDVVCFLPSSTRTFIYGDMLPFLLCCISLRSATFWFCCNWLPLIHIFWSLSLYHYIFCFLLSLHSFLFNFHQSTPHSIYC